MRNLVDVFGGPLHEFPPEVSTTVSRNDCGGYVIDLGPFEQSNDVFELCSTDRGDLELTNFVTKHEFIGVKDATESVCAEPLVFWSEDWTDGEPRESTSVTCIANGDMVDNLEATVTSRAREQKS